MAAVTSRAQFVWNGQTDPANASDDANWVGGRAPAGTSGTETVEFGAATTSGQTIQLPKSIALQALTFDGGSARQQYTFTASDGAAQLFLAGGVTAGAGGPIVFDDSLATALTDGTHLVTLTGGVSVTFAGQISNLSTSAAVTLDGDGTGSLTLSGYSTFSGGLTVNAGTLLIGSSSYNDGGIHGPAGSGTLTLKSDATLGAGGDGTYSLQNAIALVATNTDDVILDTTQGSLTLTGVISGSVPIIVNGNNTLTLSGTNTFTGPIGINSGATVAISSDRNLGASPASNGSYIQLAGGTLETTSDVQLNANRGIQLLGAGGTLSTDDGTTLTVPGIITDAATGGGTLDKTGYGSLVLNNSGSTFSHGLYIDVGELIVGASSVTHTVNNDGVTMLYFDSGPVGTGTLTLGSGTEFTTSVANVTLQNHIVFDGGFVENEDAEDGEPNLAGNLTLNGIITGSGGYDWCSNGTLTLNYASNSFGGGIYMRAGTLLLGASSTEHTGGESSYLDGPAGSGVIIFDNATRLGATADSGGIVLHNDIRITGGTVSVDTGNGDLTLHGNISGDGGINKTSEGTLTLDNPNSRFSGGVALREGSLTVAISSYINGGNFISGPLGLGTLKLYDGTTLIAEGAGNGPLTLANTIAVDCNTETGVTFQVNDNQLILTGNISGAADITKTGASTLTLSGDNSGLTGDFYVSAGTVNFNSNTAAGSGELGFGGLPGGITNFSTLAPVIGGLSGDSASDTVNLATGANLTINQTDNSVFPGIITGSASLTKVGNGQLRLSGASTYSGGTFINGGVIIAGSNSTSVSGVIQSGPLGTGSVTLNGGALNLGASVTLANQLIFASGTSNVLSGNGTFGSLIVAGNGVVISPGNSPGNLTFGAGLTIASGAAISFQVQDATGLAGTGYDLITISGGAFYLTASANTITFNVSFINADGNDGTPSNFNPASSYSWMFATSSTPITGFNANQFYLITGGASNGLPGTFSVSESGNSLFLNFTPVPEPSTYALLALGLGVIGLTLRRRRA